MDFLFKVDWSNIFVLSVSVAELFIRGTLVYLVLFTILRYLPNRQVGAVGISDLLVVVLFANAAQNAMASHYTSITDGLILVGTIIFWSYTLNYLGYRFAHVQRFLNPPPLLLVKNGIILQRNMRRELLTEGELMSQLRQQGVENLADVKQAFMEADGNISVVAHDSQPNILPEQRMG
jgi:uncharacterized membrane protein YcaP (DUF421 family)